jgi:hypothetical protein
MQQKFKDLVSLKQEPDSKNVVFLKRLVDNYPYCQPARMLLTKALMQGNKSFFEYNLNIASAIAPDRRLFRDFLEDKHPQLQQNNKAASQITTVLSEDQDVIDSQKKDKAETFNERKRRQQTIIDSFLEKNPRIEARSKDKDIPEGDIATESLEYKPDVASETLAEILLKQGKKQEAAMIYQKLSLMIPEKSSYFAKKLKSI